MKKLVMCFLSAMLIVSCSKDANVEEKVETGLKLNLTEGPLDKGGDSIEIISGSGQNLIACLDTFGMQQPVTMEFTSKEEVSDKVCYQISDMGWFSVTRVYSKETLTSSKLILKVKPNDTSKSRTVPLTIYCNCYDNYRTGSRGGVYIKTNFVQEGNPNQ